jgi:PTH1 family peptidyl-tRNA hydrolase
MRWTLAGLGNPGPEYAMTRHNVGFQVVEGMAKDLRMAWRKAKNVSYSGPFLLADDEVWLLKPLTFMNLSGQGVKPFLLERELPIEGLIVVHDEMDLPYGEVRFRFGGGTAGHKGLDSIVQALKTKDFYRVRVGIGRPSEKGLVVPYVLEPFLRQELARLPDLIGQVQIGVRVLIDEGLTKAQETFHRRLLA